MKKNINEKVVNGVDSKVTIKIKKINKKDSLMKKWNKIRLNLSKITSILHCTTKTPI